LPWQNVINNVTNGYSYAALFQPLSTNSFGRMLDATGTAVVTMYMNISGHAGYISTTWRMRTLQQQRHQSLRSIHHQQMDIGVVHVQQGLGVMYVNGVPAASNTTVNLTNSWLVKADC